MVTNLPNPFALGSGLFVPKRASVFVLLAGALLAGCTVGTRRTATPVAAACMPGSTSWGCQQPVGNAPMQNNPQGYPATGPQPLPMGNQVPANQAPAPRPTATGASAGAGATGTVTTTAIPVDDAINRADLTYLRGRLQADMAELVAALDSTNRARVERIPLIYDNSQTEVNAFAGCSGGKSLLAVTDGLLVLTAHLAQAQATDEVFGTRKLDEYVAYVAKNQRQNQPVVIPPNNFYTNDQRYNAQKLVRQQQLVDEALCFVLAHELGHHYLNHLPCTSVLPLDASEIGIALSSAVPAFNQPAEVAADMAGIRNVIGAGQRRSGYHYTEGGGLMTMRFFQALDNATPAEVFDFERTHPPPSVREPIIRTTAQAVRAGGGISWPWSL